MGYRMNGEGLDVFVVLLTAQLKQQTEASSSTTTEQLSSTSEGQVVSKPALPMVDLPAVRTALNYQELSNVLYALACFGHAPSNELQVSEAGAWHPPLMQGWRVHCCLSRGCKCTHRLPFVGRSGWKSSTS